MSQRKNLSSFVSLFLFAVGIFALVWMVRKVGLANINDIIQQMDGWVLPLLLNSFVSILLSAAAIHIFIRPEQRMIRYWRVVAIQLSGQSINSVTPTGTVGEIAKVTMLSKHVPKYRAISSIVSYNIACGIAYTLSLMTATGCTLLFLDVSSELKDLLLFVMGGMVVLGGLLIVVSRRGFSHTMFGVVNMLGLSSKRTQEWSRKLEKLDQQMSFFSSERITVNLYGTSFLLIAELLGWFDLWLILHIIGHSEGLVFVIVASGASNIVSSLASVVPLGLG